MRPSTNILARFYFHVYVKNLILKIKQSYNKITTTKKLNKLNEYK